MISGDGFFVTSKGGSQLFTRAGAFSPDAANQLVSPDGGILQVAKAQGIGDNGLLGGGPARVGGQQHQDYTEGDEEARRHGRSALKMNSGSSARRSSRDDGSSQASVTRWL